MKSFIVTADGVTLYLDGKSYTADKTHPNYSKIISAIQTENWEDVPALVDVANALQEFVSDSTVQVHAAAGVVSYNGEPLRGYLVDRILTMMEQGFNIKPMTAYLENLMQNSSKRAIDELHGFNEFGNMPITEDGYFIAYKRIDGWYDTHTGQVLNKPAELLTAEELAMLPYTVNGVTVAVADGKLTVSMPRNKVDDRATQTCSQGLHFCSQAYLKEFSGNRIVVLKINPADVVSIPVDYNNTKGRCCKYQVIDVLSEEDFNKAMNVDVFSTPVYDTGSDVDETWDEEDDGGDDTEGAVTKDFVSGYVTGYASGRAKTGNHAITGSDDYIAGYQTGYKDGKGHKPKQYKL